MIDIDKYIKTTIEHIQKNNCEYEIKRSFKDLLIFYSLLDKENKNNFEEKIKIYIKKLNKKEMKIFKFYF